MSESIIHILATKMWNYQTSREKQPYACVCLKVTLLPDIHVVKSNLDLDIYTMHQTSSLIGATANQQEMQSRNLLLFFRSLGTLSPMVTNPLWGFSIQ